MIPRVIRGKTKEEQIAYLITQGLSQEAAEDFINDYKLLADKFEKVKRTDSGRFSKSETFKQMVEGFKSRIYGSE